MNENYDSIKRKSFASVCRSKPLNKTKQNKALRPKYDGHLNWTHPISVSQLTNELPASNATYIPQEYWDELFESAFFALNKAPHD